MRRRRRREIGKEQIHLGGVAAPPDLGYIRVCRKKAKRDVRLAMLGEVDQLLQLRDRLVDAGYLLGRSGAQAAEALFEDLAETRRARQAHHAEGPAHLVKMLGAIAEYGSVLRGGGVRRDLRANALERLIDFGADPGKDRGIRHRAPATRP